MTVLRRLLRLALVAAVVVAMGWIVDLPRFWVFAAIWFVMAVYLTLAADPAMFRERRRPAGPTIDRGALLTIRSLAAASVLVTFMDITRFHWSDTVPLAVRTVAMVVLAAASAIVARAMVANRFFSIAVRIQDDRGHHVVADGPYTAVRHPGYLGMMTAMPSFALAFGSWWALLPALAYAALIARRAGIEDRFLHEKLEGYAAYAKHVRFRLIPGVW